MENMGSIIEKHNKKILSNTPAISDDGCNCRKQPTVQLWILHCKGILALVLKFL